MEATKKRHIKSGREYDHLFPSADGDNATIRPNANVYDTVAFIPKVVNETLYQTKQLAEHLKANNTYETCKNIWQFVFEHINYKKDAAGYEQIRSPARAWHDRFSGVDCDCYSVFISSILSNLEIPHTLRITKYHRDYFQHIYPIVPFQNGYITLDCVTDRFNYEVPFSEKKDYPMDLQYLSGFEDGNEMYGDGMAELGKLIQKKMGGPGKKMMPAKKAMPVMKKKPVSFLKQKKNALPVQNAEPNALPDGNNPKKKKKVFGKILNVVNKANPATVLLRNGILASMKLNIRNTAGRLRWSYLSPQQATAKSIDPVKFQKLIAARQKLEKIFYGAGGNPKNLKKAILSGKGNKDKAVNGLEGFGMLELEGVEYTDVYTPMNELLGTEIYYDENVNGMGGFGELGEPITLASIAAAAGVVAGIVAMLKDVGNIFQKKTKEAEDFDEKKNEEADKENPVPTPTTATPSIVPTVTVKENTEEQENTVKAVVKNSESVNNEVVKFNTEQTPAAKTEVIPTNATETNITTKDGADNNNNDNPGFWEKNKKWLKPVAIGVGGLAIIGIGYAMMKGSKTQNKSSPPGKGLSGTPNYKKQKNHKRKQNKQYKKRAVALL